MIKILKKIPQKVVVAVSGGPDSMAVLDFLSNGPSDVSAIFIHHGTTASDAGQNVVLDFCNTRGIVLQRFSVGQHKPKRKSWEEFWRHERYKIFHAIKLPVITAHHLDDVMETWAFTSCHGNPQLIPYSNKNVIRPFLLNSKETLKSWIERKNVPFSIDSSNNDDKYMRNYIRRHIMPHYRHVNPGIEKTIRKLILLKNQGEKNE